MVRPLQFGRQTQLRDFHELDDGQSNDRVGRVLSGSDSSSSSSSSSLSCVNGSRRQRDGNGAPREEEEATTPILDSSSSPSVLQFWSFKRIPVRTRYLLQQSRQKWTEGTTRENPAKDDRPYVRVDEGDSEEEEALDMDTESGALFAPSKSPCSLTTKPLSVPAVDTPETIHEDFEQDDSRRTTTTTTPSSPTTRLRVEALVLSTPEGPDLPIPCPSTLSTPPIADLSCSPIAPSTPPPEERYKIVRFEASPVQLDFSTLLLKRGCESTAASDCEHSDPPHIPPVNTRATVTTAGIVQDLSNPTPLLHCQQESPPNNTCSLDQDGVEQPQSSPPAEAEPTQQPRPCTTLTEGSLIRFEARVNPPSADGPIHRSDSWFMTLPTASPRGAMLDDVSSLGSETPTKILLAQAAAAAAREQGNRRSGSSRSAPSPHHTLETADQTSDETDGSKGFCICMPQFIRRVPPILRYALMVGAALWIAAAALVALALVLRNHADQNDGQTASVRDSWTDSWTYPPALAPTMRDSSSPSLSLVPTVWPSTSSQQPNEPSGTPVSTTISNVPSTIPIVTTTAIPTVSTSPSMRPSPEPMPYPSLHRTTVMPVGHTQFPTFESKPMMGMGERRNRSINRM